MKKCLSRVIVSLLASMPTCNAAYLPPMVSQQVAVVTAHRLATQVGIEILREGGNAVDAAVAIGYALAVVHSCCGNIGGGGFMLIHFANNKNLVIDFRETAPAAINPKLYQDDKGNIIRQLAEQSYLAVGVPGTVMGLNTALQKYGTLKLAKVMRPAIQLAAQGFTLENEDLPILNKNVDKFRKQTNVASIFLKNNQPYQVNDRLVQPQLAKTLKLISKKGSAGFYQGVIATKLVAFAQANQGVLTMRDFANYQVKEREVLTCYYHQYEIITAPPPSSGLTLCEILNVLNQFPMDQVGFHSAASVHYNVEAMRYAFADRNQLLGDPDFVSIPISHLLSNDYAKQIARKIQADKAGNSQILVKSASSETGNTTHFAVVDRMGNAVGVTDTINSYFGTGLIAGDTGFFLNNNLDDFALAANAKNMYGLQQGETNLIAPNKRPLSSMSPTMIFKNHQLYMVLGAAGGPTIITSLVESIENIVDYHMDINAAINEPRFHFQWFPDVIFLEPYSLSADTLQKLQIMGYSFHWGSPFNTDYWGQELGILKDSDSNILYSATDNRHAGGLSLGY